jgi:predicted deacetylase
MNKGAERAEKFRVRPYRHEDRVMIRKICADTGYLGKPIDPVFEDRELFADFLTAPYTDAEPENCFVLEGPHGAVEGFLTASSDSGKRRRYLARNFPFWLGRAIRGFFGGYGPATRKYLLWLILRGRRETPQAPANAAHFHINLLPKVRSVAAARSLIDTFLEAMGQRGVRCVYGQIVTQDDRRGERMFARYGFRVTDRTRVTKFRDHSDAEVHLCTVVKDLAESPLLYGKDLQRQGGRRHGRQEKKLLLSLHDFHPKSREQIGEQLEFCLKRCPGHASILVVPEYHHGPGVESCPESLRSLERWQTAGHDLAVHGYFHDRKWLPAESWFWTRLYTNQEAEFFRLDPAEAESRIDRALAIWRRQGWAAKGFVAPGWLQEPSTEAILRQKGFAYTCRLTEVLHLADGQRDRAWAGTYSLRSPWRRALARRWQPFWKRAWGGRRLVRLSLHPADLEVGFVRDQVGGLLAELSARGYRSVSYAEHVQV